ncbi:MAG: FixH family protein [Candidatus Cloacimonetes bacterium]|nr:FixH family protein [Candidatus Cloacimonadota bacterium]
MKKILIITVIVILALPMLAQHCGGCTSPAKELSVLGPTSKQVIAKPKAIHWIDSNYYLIYNWDKKPKIGNHILLVDVYNKNKQVVRDIQVTANAYMPSMKGSHDTGDKKMQLNKKQKYAIPVNFMMLGDWEIELKFSKGSTSLGKAFVKLDIK